MAGISTEDETALLEDILAGLRAALEKTEASLGENDDDEFRQVKDIRVNKLVQHAVKDAGLPVFWSWFRYGQSIPHRKVMGWNVWPEELDAGEEDTSQESVIQTAKTRKEYRDYFIDEVSIGDATGIEEICGLSIEEFLEAAYDEAPEDYQDLYVANLEAQNLFREIALQSEWLSQEDYYDAVWEVTRNFQKEMIRHAAFTREMRDAISKYIRVVRQAVVGAQMHEELTEDQREVLKNLADAYHDPVWKLLSMKISAETATGRDEGLKSEKYNQKADNMISEVSSTVESLPRELETEGLLPEKGDFPSEPDDDLQSAVVVSESRIYSSI